VFIVSRAFPAFSFLYYASIPLFIYFIAASFKYFLKEKKFRIFLILNSIFFLWAIITSIWSLYPTISLARSLYLLLLSSSSVCAGFLWMKFSSKQDRFNKLFIGQEEQNPLGYMLLSNSLIILICLFSLFTGIPDNTWTGGHGKGFMGFAGHQNVLASVILFTFPSILYPFTNWKEYINEKFKIRIYIPVILLLFNVFFLIITYSRASILSFLIIIMLYFLFVFKWKAFAVYTLVAILFGSLFLFVSSFRGEAERLLLKKFPSLLFSREILIEPSYRAALNGGFTGLGYGVSDPGIILHGITGSHYEDGRYVREKGNSILALVEETGVIGLVLFIIPVLYIFRISGSVIKQLSDSTIKQSTTIKSFSHSLKTYALLISVIVALILHAQFEAWWVGVGSVQLPLFFLILGSALGKISSIPLKDFNK